MVSKQLKEKIAHFVHESWSRWMEHLFNICHCHADGTVTIPKELVLKWQRQLRTEYKNLSEKEKDSDREEADIFVKAINKYGDGYHTFDELYKHRVSLFLALCKTLNDKCGEKVYRLKNHYEGWDCIFLMLNNKQISYHVPTFEAETVSIAFTEINESIWDGHSSQDVLNILDEYSREI